MSKQQGRMPPIHPGEVLKEILEEADITAYALAKAIGKSQIQVSRILNEKSGITAPMARLLGAALGLTPEMLMRWQSHYDLAVAAQKMPVLQVTPIVKTELPP
jgi:addiction module HigA family antidote